jgi:hypothetical protein
LIRGLMMDDEWAIVEPFLTNLFLRGGRPPANHRRVDGILWICRAGGATCRRRFDNWNSIWRHELMEQHDSDPGAALADKGYDRDAPRPSRSWLCAGDVDGSPDPRISGAGCLIWWDDHGRREALAECMSAIAG